MRQLSDGERSILNEQDRDGAPDWRTLNHRQLTRGPKPCECDVCHHGIETGQRYHCVAALEDGRFVMLRHHVLCPEGPAHDPGPYG